MFGSITLLSSHKFRMTVLDWYEIDSLSSFMGLVQLADCSEVNATPISALHTATLPRSASQHTHTQMTSTNPVSMMCSLLTSALCLFLYTVHNANVWFTPVSCLSLLNYKKRWYFNIYLQIFIK